MDGYYAWMIVATALVLMMTTPALALFYGGMTRSKSVLNMMMMSYVAMAVVGIVYVLWGWSESFGPKSLAGGLFADPFTPVRPQGRRVGLVRRGLLPAHLRGDHRGADLRRHRRPGEAVVLGGVPAALGHAVLLPARPHGLGRRLDLARTSRPRTTRAARWCTSTPVSRAACSR